MISEGDPPVSAVELERRLDALRGEVELPVPSASAVKIAGERAYRLARRGVAVEMPVRRSHVHELRLLELDGGVARLELHVSSGTYVRSIADALGGHCATLRRTAVGPFGVEDADPERIVPPVDALPFLPLVEVSDDEALAVRQGRRRFDDAVRVVSGGELVAVGRTVLPA